jgi:hypothetical protein
MSTRRYKYLRTFKKNKTNKTTSRINNKTGKRWVTSIEAASYTLNKTGSIKAAKNSLKKQALFNARKLFGSINN